MPFLEKLKSMGLNTVEAYISGLWLFPYNKMIGEELVGNAGFMLPIPCSYIQKGKSLLFF